MADFESALAPQQSSNKIPLSSLINMAVSQQRDQRDFEHRKKEYSASQLIGRLKSYEDDPVKYQSYYKVLESRPDVSGIFKDVGIDLTQFAPVIPSREELSAEGIKNMGVKADILESGEGKRLKKLQEEILSGETRARKEGDMGYARTKSGGFTSLSRKEAAQIGTRFLDQTEYEKLEKSAREFDADYNMLAREFAKYPDPSQVNVIDLMKGVTPAGQNIAPDKYFSNIMANYQQSLQGTDFEKRAKLEEKFFRAIMEKKDITDNEGNVYKKEDMLKYLEESPALQGNKSPYWYFAQLGPDVTKKELPAKTKKLFSFGAM